jgi:tetratricopeptide (TPR) repeat protein
LTVKEGKVEFFNDLGTVEATEMTESVAKADAKPTEPKRLAMLKVHQLRGTLVWSTQTSRLTLPAAVDRLVFPLGWVGLTVRDVVPETLEQVLSPERKGPPDVPPQVRVVRVMRGSPAERAGLKVGDVITALNGKPVSKAAEVNNVIFARPQARLRLTVSRGNQQQPVTLTTTTSFDAPPMPRLSRRAARRLYEATWLLIGGKTDEAESALLKLKGDGETGRWGNREKAAVENNLGVLYETKDKEMSTPIRYYQQAVQADPKVALYHFNLGMALRSIGNLERAKEELQTAVRLAPRWIRARTSLADVYTLLERGDDALRTMEAALKLNPQLPDTYWSQSWMLMRQRRLDEALQAARRAVELEPTWVIAYLQMGRVYADRGEEAEERKWFRQSIELHPGYAAGYHNLAMHWPNLKERENLYRKSIELDPDQRKSKPHRTMPTRC